MKTPPLCPSFRWLNATQFLGAMNDNVFKLLVTFFTIHVLGNERAGELTSIGGLLFALPFILFLPASGALSDRISKRTVIVWAKVLEIVVMVAAVVVFALGHAMLSFALLFLMSLQSTLFGPAKYGIIPELASREQLSRANGLIVGATYVAIVIGTFGGSWLREAAGDRFALAGLVCVGIAVAGTLTSFPIARTPIANPRAKASWLFFRDAWRVVRDVRGDRFLVLAILGSAYFSLIGAFMQLNIIPYGMQHYGRTDAGSGFLFLFAAIGIGAGSYLAGRLSGRNIEFGVLPLAAGGLGLASLLLTTLPPLPVVKVLLFFAGLFAGLYIVPLDAFVQWRAPKERIGEVIAAMNWLGWIGVLGASLLGLLFYAALDLSPRAAFAAIGVLTLALTVFALWLLPDFVVRFVTVTLTRTLYRIKPIGLENLPVEGGGLLVANHVSFMDAVQILAVQQRRIRFLMHRRIYETHPLRMLFRLMGVIPIATEDPPKKIVESLRAARRAMDDGYLVCIFAEGALTRTGLMRGFKPGFERIVKGSSHPILPVHIGGTWGSIFSHYYGKQHLRMPTQFPYPVTITFGKPLPATARAAEVRQAVMELSTTYFENRKPMHRSLAAACIASTRRHWSRRGLSDTTGRDLTFGQALVGGLALARVLRRRVADQPNVGVLLPPAVGSAVVNLSLAILRKASVNLNFTASQQAFESAIRQAGLRTILTSRAFIEKFPQHAGLAGLVFVDDLAKEIGPLAKIRALLAARFAPVCWLTPLRKASPDDTATIIFSSGTTGEPKGVLLSHHNILSNVEQCVMVLRPTRHDNLCATLPLFHSFGFTCGLWLPLIAGMAASYHTSPLDTARVVQMIRERKCTALFATPTFLLGYLRRAERDDLASLRIVIAGAEKLKPRLADAFEERFGIRPMEGYGATELSPVAALSLPDVDIDGVYQAGGKSGSVGQPVPGMAARVVDPETGVVLPLGATGLLEMKGPNVMTGYLDRPDLTAETVRDGWYRTGDMVTIDDEGFITITDRLARFSKIGGEMVPHIAVEDAYLKGLGTTEPWVAVTSVPDEKRGERLIVLYTAAAADVDRLRAIIDASDLPNLWKPARDAYAPIDAVPLTGSGKLDVKALRALALAAAPGEG